MKSQGEALLAALSKGKKQSTPASPELPPMAQEPSQAPEAPMNPNMSMEDTLKGAMSQEDASGEGLTVEMGGQPLTDPNQVADALLSDPVLSQAIKAKLGIQ